MITQYEVPVRLVEALSGIEKELKRISPTLNIFKSIRCLVNYTRNKVAQHDLKLLKKCFFITEKIYTQGNVNMKSAVENVFVFSLSLIMNACNVQERSRL